MKNDKFMLAPEVENVARDLIEDHHAHLIGARIKYLFRLGKWVKKTRQTLGQAKLAAEDVRFIADFDFIVTINHQAWNYADKLYRQALVDHELFHCVDNADVDDDEPNWGIADHDVQEFVSVVSRYGLWEEGLKKLMDAAKNPHNTTQGKLFDGLTAEEAIGELAKGREVEIYNDGKTTGTIRMVNGMATEAKIIDNETGER